jgi:hypothetical protein
MIRPIIAFVFLSVLGGCSGGSSDSKTPATPTAAQMSVTPAVLQATVDIGTNGSLSFTVRNNGGSKLTFQATTGESWLSGLENLGSVDVNAGASRTVNLQVQCQAIGSLSGSVSVTGSDQDNPSDTVSVNVDCVTPALQIQITDAPGASNGAPSVDAQSSLTWGISSSGSQQPTVGYTVTSSEPSVVISNNTGTLGPSGQISNNLSYPCPAPQSLTATITISAGGSEASSIWQIECVAVLEGNITFDSAELYQGPLAASIDANLNVTEFVDTIVDRQALFVVQLGHDSSTVPEFALSVLDSGQSTAVTSVLTSVQSPAETGTGRWASLYTMNIAGSFMQTGNDLIAVMDPNNQIAEINENDNTVTIDMTSLALVLVPEFKPVFVPINAEGRVPAAIVLDDYLEATVDLLPIANHTDSVRATYDYQGGAWVWQTALTELAALWNAEAAADEFYHGVYRQPDSFNGGTTGIGFIGFPVAVSASLDSPLGSDDVVAHEFGHNFGLNHAPGGCNEGSPDPNYPYAFGAIGPIGGWLFSAAQYIAPEDGYFDVMTYCEPRYISDYHYQNAIDAIAVGQSISAQSVSGFATGSIALSGSVDEHGLWTMTHALASTKPARAPKPGPFSLALYGHDGIELYRQELDIHHANHASFAVWAVRVPVPGAPLAAVRVWDASGNLILDEALTL